MQNFLEDMCRVTYGRTKKKRKIFEKMNIQSNTVVVL